MQTWTMAAEGGGRAAKLQAASCKLQAEGRLASDQPSHPQAGKGRRGITDELDAGAPPWPARRMDLGLDPGGQGGGGGAE